MMPDSNVAASLSTENAAARRDFLKGAGLAVAATLATGAAQADPGALTADEKLDRLASNTYPIRWLFKRREGAAAAAANATPR
jgi:hypothetical protein